MSIVFPANVIGFFKTMIPVVMFDFLSDIPIIEDIFSEEEVDKSKNNIRE
jgi:hypothetical protein